MQSASSAPQPMRHRSLDLSVSPKRRLVGQPFQQIFQAAYVRRGGPNAARRCNREQANRASPAGVVVFGWELPYARSTKVRIFQRTCLCCILVSAAYLSFRSRRVCIAACGEGGGGGAGETTGGATRWRGAASGTELRGLRSLGASGLEPFRPATSGGAVLLTPLGEPIVATISRERC